MINCNPETVSTDYDTSDRLYFEPLTLEDVLAVIELEQPEGVIVQFGGQTPLRLAAGLDAAGVPLLGTSVDAIDAAEDRGRFGELLDRLGYQAPPYATARTVAEALAAGARGRLPAARAPELRARRPGDGDRLLRRGPRRATSSARAGAVDGREIFLDHFLENAIEVDVDALCDGTRRRGSAGSCSTSRRPGIHSGDSACVLPPHSLGEEMLDADPRADARDRARARRRRPDQRAVRRRRRAAGRALRDRGQPARLADGARSSPRRSASPLAKLACRIMLGEPIADARPARGSDERTATSRSRRRCCRSTASSAPTRCSGPEMRSTGEVMGIAHRLPDRVREGPGRGGRGAARPAAPCSSP